MALGQECNYRIGRSRRPHPLLLLLLLLQPTVEEALPVSKRLRSQSSHPPLSPSLPLSSDHLLPSSSYNGKTIFTAAETRDGIRKRTARASVTTASTQKAKTERTDSCSSEEDATSLAMHLHSSSSTNSNGLSWTLDPQGNVPDLHYISRRSRDKRLKVKALTMTLGDTQRRHTVSINGHKLRPSLSLSSSASAAQTPGGDAHYDLKVKLKANNASEPGSQQGETYYQQHNHHRHHHRKVAPKRSPKSARHSHSRNNRTADPHHSHKTTTHRDVSSVRTSSDINLPKTTASISAATTTTAAAAIGRKKSSSTSPPKAHHRPLERRKRRTASATPEHSSIDSHQQKRHYRNISNHHTRVGTASAAAAAAAGRDSDDNVTTFYTSIFSPDTMITRSKAKNSDVQAVHINTSPVKSQTPYHSTLSPLRCKIPSRAQEVSQEGILNIPSALLSPNGTSMVDISIECRTRKSFSDFSDGTFRNGIRCDHHPKEEVLTSNNVVVKLGVNRDDKMFRGQRSKCVEDVMAYDGGGSSKNIVSVTIDSSGQFESESTNGDAVCCNEGTNPLVINGEIDGVSAGL